MPDERYGCFRLLISAVYLLTVYSLATFRRCAIKIDISFSIPLRPRKEIPYVVQSDYFLNSQLSVYSVNIVDNYLIKVFFIDQMLDTADSCYIEPTSVNFSQNFLCYLLPGIDKPYRTRFIRLVLPPNKKNIMSCFVLAESATR